MAKPTRAEMLARFGDKKSQPYQKGPLIQPRHPNSGQYLPKGPKPK